MQEWTRRFMHRPVQDRRYGVLPGSSPFLHRFGSSGINSKLNCPVESASLIEI